MTTKNSVLERYTAGAREVQADLCCPVDYSSELLALLPREIIDKDYGCGDPSRYVREGDTVLDLGSGGGKICYMAAQLVGQEGRVIGVDMNDDMLALARKYQDEMAKKLGGDRVCFLKGYIQDLALDVAAMEDWLAEHPVSDAAGYARLLDWQDRQRAERPLIPDASVDLVISNCVLNLVHDDDKGRLLREIHRVLKPGGRVAIADIVSDEPVPAHLKADPELWSGCISGAFQEQDFIRGFRDAGFLAVRVDKWDGAPWRVVEGIEFRSVTLTAVKGEGSECLDRGQAVIYRGPYAEVHDDEGHVFPRGERMAVCERTYRLLTEGPYGEDFIGISPAAPREVRPWCAPPGTRRPASETKGAAHDSGGCGTDGCC
ncbi:MAG TPA: methyltransferase domain-containing protein [Gammaproteobacteria bacterium]|nr:methyltransferase domain-containing protein [Gammaproteobacteria bacterium]